MISMQRHRWILVITLISILIAVFGCGAEPPVEDEEPVAEEEAAPEPGGTDYPLDITDDAGRSVSIPRQPERVVSFAPSNTEILFHLGIGDTLVAVDDFSDWPAEELQAIPNIGGVENPNYETILEREPDLVFTIGGTDEFVSRLADLGIESVVIQPRTFDDIYDSILLVGRIMNVPEIAEQVVADMQEEVDEVADLAAQMPEEDRPKVFFEVWPQPLMTAGPNSFIGFLIQTAGGRLISDDVEGDWVEFSLETLVDRDPDVILTTFSETVSELKRGERAGWEDVTAVEKEALHKVEVEQVTHPSPRIVEGLQAIARILHPDKFD